MNYTVKILDDKIPDIIAEFDKKFINSGIKVTYWSSGDNSLRRQEKRPQNSIYYISLNVDIYRDISGQIIKPIYENNILKEWLTFEDQIYLHRGRIAYTIPDSSGKTNSGGRIVFDIWPDGKIKRYLISYDVLTEPYLIEYVTNILTEVLELSYTRVIERTNKIKEELSASTFLY